jgi:(p)ppGpp synthase/HD superfamily hydrolase
MTLSHQFGKALRYATRIHGGQLRKKTRIPYIAHILGVTAIAMEYGATETEAIGALLHDAVEDCGGAKRLRDIERKFGKPVAKIVDGCTDTDQTPKPPWLTRKKTYTDGNAIIRGSQRRAGTMEISLLSEMAIRTRKRR